MKLKTMIWTLNLVLVSFMLFGCGGNSGGNNSDASSPIVPTPDTTPSPDGSTPPSHNGTVVAEGLIKDSTGATVGGFLGASGAFGNATYYGLIILNNGLIVFLDLMSGTLNQERIYFPTADCSGSDGYIKFIDTSIPMVMKNRVLSPGDGTYYKVVGRSNKDVQIHSVQNTVSGGGCGPSNILISSGGIAVVKTNEQVFDFKTIAPITISLQ